jgi:hypothetical protein
MFPQRAIKVNAFVALCPRKACEERGRKTESGADVSGGSDVDSNRRIENTNNIGSSLNKTGVVFHERGKKSRTNNGTGRRGTRSAGTSRIIAEERFSGST